MGLKRLNGDLISPRKWLRLWRIFLAVLHTGIGRGWLVTSAHYVVRGGFIFLQSNHFDIYVPRARYALELDFGKIALLDCWSQWKRLQRLYLQCRLAQCAIFS